MKVLLVNGSMRPEGCTDAALNIVAEQLREEGIEAEIFWIPNEPVYDCVGCNKCIDMKKCCINDCVNELVAKAAESDGFIFGSPVYYASPTGKLLSVLDRAFYSGTKHFMFKPGASVISARREGATSSFDVLNKYFTISSMPIVSSTYWNNVHGREAADVYKDAEGVETMKNLARSMAWMLKNIEAGKQAGITRPKNKYVKTDYIREDL